MQEAIRRFASGIGQKIVWEALLKLWPIIGAGVMAWLLYLSDIFTKYAPFSYGVAFTAFLVLYCLIRVMMVAVSAWRANVRLKNAHNKIVEKLSSKGHSINPLDSVFQDKRIFLNDFYNVYEPLIQNKTFINCELIGPATVFFRQVDIVGLSSYECDFIKARPGAHAFVGMALDNVTLRNCKIYKVTCIMAPLLAERYDAAHPIDNKPKWLN